VLAQTPLQQLWAVFATLDIQTLQLYQALYHVFSAILIAGHV
jgi:hypothetical protein